MLQTKFNNAPEIQESVKILTMRLSALPRTLVISSRHWITEMISSSTTASRTMGMSVGSISITASSVSSPTTTVVTLVDMFAADEEVDALLSITGILSAILNNTDLTSSSSLTFNVPRTQSAKDHTLFTALRQCWTIDFLGYPLRYSEPSFYSPRVPRFPKYSTKKKNFFWTMKGNIYF